MKKPLLIATLLATTTLFSDSVIISDERPSFQKHHTFNKTIKTTTKSSNRTFKRDHHRYDKRYSNFDYDRNGYYDDEGYYYGYYDNRGYFFNNIFFEYSSDYTYHDRVYIRGYFQPHHHHRRVYRYHSYNNWNRVHCYREPNTVVEGYYYDYPSHYSSHRNSHRTHYYERDRARVTHGRFSDHDNGQSYRRVQRRRENFRHDNRYNNRHHNNYRNTHRSHRRDRDDNYRERRHNRSNAHIRHGRFSDKSHKDRRGSRKNSGHLSISQ